jgi:hypothetical protein
LKELQEVLEESAEVKVDVLLLLLLLLLLLILAGKVLFTGQALTLQDVLLHPLLHKLLL